MTSPAPCPQDDFFQSQADADRAVAAALSTARQAAPDAEGGQPPRAADPFDNLRDETEISGKYLPVFIDEAETSLDELTETLLVQEGRGSREALENLLITAHRIKGSAASLGLNRAAKLAHLMEDLLQSTISRNGFLTAGLTDVLLKCTDGLREYVVGLRKGSPRSEHFGRLAAELRAVRESAATAATPAPAEPVAPADPGPPTHRLPELLHSEVAKAACDDAATLVGLVTFRPDLPLVGLKAKLVLEKLSHLGQVCYFDPPAESLEGIETLGEVAFGLTTDRPMAAILKHLRIGGTERITVEPLMALGGMLSRREASGEHGSRDALAHADPRLSRVTACHTTCHTSRGTGKSPAAESAGKEIAGKLNETLRVDIERLDQLMNLAGQLAINKARLARTAEAIRREAVGMAGVRGALGDLAEAIHQLDRVSDAVQRSVMDMRMVPIGPLFNRFKRVVRDLTRANGKSIRLAISGEKTELDKRMIDELGDPLLHMVRNAADHGIESPDVRAAAGKPREGTILLDAFHRGSSIVIRVSDDGRGLDADGILRKAMEKGLAGPTEAGKLTPQQIYPWIWVPGLTTAEKVTDVSGRGMGMDIARSKIDELNGSIELESTPGRGTTLSIKLPLTLAILPSLMVDVAGEIFAVPIESVVEIVRVKREDLTTVYGTPTARVRNRIVSLAGLDEIFAWGEDDAGPRSAESDETTLVIVGERGREIGLAVSDVLGEEDVVIKSMAENFRNVPGIAGASILGDGRVSLILDAPALIDMASRRAAAGKCT